MNAMTQHNPKAGALVSAEQQEAIRTALKTSLYPGASDGSVDLVLSYCRASGLDPMTKPVHIVPMKVTTGKDDRGWDVKETRDVIMPGIGLYRTNASRTGQYAGCSEPVFGPTRELTYKREIWTDGPNNKRIKKLVDGSMQYPEWCRVTVRKLLGSTVVEFTAVEYWLENYATKGDEGAPNAMWEKRAFGQLAKCTEAQALRKAFPEAVGSQPTAEEMEGKTIEGEFTTVQQAARTEVREELPPYPDADFAENLPKWWGVIASGKKSADDLIAMLQTKARFTPEQLKEIRTPPRDEEEGTGEKQEDQA